MASHVWEVSAISPFNGGDIVVPVLSVHDLILDSRVPCAHEIVQADADHHNLLCMLWPLGKTRQEALESVHKLPEGISTTRLAREQR